MKTVLIALRATAVTLVLTGLLYPLAMTGAAQALFPEAAAGSLIKDATGKVVGSRLIGQAFTGPGYFQGRLSAAGNGYDATASGGSNFASTSAKLHDRIQADVARLQKDNPVAPGPIPAELVTASASGLDPHVSPQTARWQVARVAQARGVSGARVLAVVEEHVEGRDLGVLGEPTVNLLMLNLALDRQFGRPPVAQVAR
jgi:K+-transporting ATPase ATPase C chain